MDIGRLPLKHLFRVVLDRLHSFPTIVFDCPDADTGRGGPSALFDNRQEVAMWGAAHATKSLMSLLIHVLFGEDTGTQLYNGCVWEIPWEIQSDKRLPLCG